MHPKSPYWFGRFTDHEGTQRNRSTRETERRKAQVIVDGWEHAARLAKRGTLTADKARAVLSEILERTTAGQESIRSEPADAFLARWLEHKAAVKSEATAARYRTTIALFLEHLGDRRSRPLTTIRAADVQSFLTRRGKARSSKTVSVDGKSLSAAFNYARRQGLIDRNPCEGVELPDVESKERHAFTQAQVRLLAGAGEGDWRTAILCGYYLGARLTDVVNLTWKDVDFTAEAITYRQRKTRTQVTTPLHPELERHLSTLATDTAVASIMPTLAGRNSGGKTGLSAQFNGIMRTAGIGGDVSVQKSGRRFSSLSFHSLRHSFESHLAAANVSAETRRELVGRADEATQRTYTHNDLEHMRAELAKLPSLFNHVGK